MVPAFAGMAGFPAKAGTPSSPRQAKQPVAYILASKPYGTLYVGVTQQTRRSH